MLLRLIGPFPSEDKSKNILIARPIPPGLTVIAKPVVGAPPAPLTLPHEKLTKVDPEECTPVLPNSIKVDESTNAKDKTTSPMVMMWNSDYPDGRLVPLRQPAPPVYFQPVA